MNNANKIQQEKALKTLRKIVSDKKIVLESIKRGVSAVELQKKGIKIASPI
jgi:hypothetical protein